MNTTEPLRNSSTEAQCSSAICLHLHSSLVAKPGLELRATGSHSSAIPGSIPPPTPAYEGESLLIPLTSGFFLRTMRPGWGRTAFLGRRMDSAKCRVGIWMPGAGVFCGSLFSSVQRELGRQSVGLSPRWFPTNNRHYLLSLCHMPSTVLHICYC